jgi:hypothetical protein
MLYLYVSFDLCITSELSFILFMKFDLTEDRDTKSVEKVEDV